MWLDLTWSPSFNIKQGGPNLKVLVTCLLSILEVYNLKPTHRKSWAGILLMLLDLTFGPPLQGQMMVHWLWRVVFTVDTNLHRFSDA